MKTKKMNPFNRCEKSLQLNLLLIAFTVLGITFSGCNKEKEPVDPNAGSELLSIGVDRINTRALDDAFEVMDEIGIFAVKWNGDSPDNLLPSGNYADNVKFTLLDNNDTWEASEPIYYPAEGEKLDLYAYYPYTENALDAAHAIIKFLVNTDQTDYADYTASDLIVSSREGVSHTSQKIHLTFDHKLSQMIFGIKAGEGYTVEELQTARIIIKNAIIDTEFDLSEGNRGTPVTGEVRSDVVPTGEWQPSQNDATALYGYKAIIVPQELNQNSYLEIKVGTRTFTQRFNTPIEMESGQSRSFTITINNTEAALSTTLNPWNYGDPFEGVAEEEVYDEDCLVLEVNIDKFDENSNSAEFKIYLYMISGYAKVDWGNNESSTTSAITGTIRKSYGKFGTYIVKIRFWNYPDRPIYYFTEVSFRDNKYIKRVIQWGNHFRINNWENVFLNCPKLESVPLFPPGKKFNNTFKNCPKLTQIPEDLFKNSPEATSFNYTFEDCFNLKQIPEGLFDKCVDVTSFKGTFSGCTSLTGTTPKTNDVELWQRHQYPEYPNAITITDCFKGCIALDNYDDIPDEAK